MAERDHWHPVLRSRDLGYRPRSVTLMDEEIVLFRTAQGALGALTDECPHRRMRLSCGKVDGERLVCPYHGYRFGPDGVGESASTPRMRVDARRWDVAERHGAIWVKAAGADAPLPELDRAGFFAAGVLTDRVRAPLETVVDNFCEVEHTPSTHALFGYRPDSLGDLETKVESGDDWLRVWNRGPQKPVPRLVERLFGIAGGDAFVDDWTVYFSPVHIVYAQWWEDAATGVPKGDRLHLAVFFVPVDAHTTELFVFPYSTRAPRGLDRLITPLFRALTAREVALDRKMIERLADPRPDLRGTRLSRFDSPLRLHRERIARLYRGEAPSAG